MNENIVLTIKQQHFQHVLNINILQGLKEFNDILDNKMEAHNHYQC